MNPIFIIIMCIVLVFIFATLFSKHKWDLGQLSKDVAKIQLDEHNMKIIYEFNANSCLFVGDIRGDLMSLMIALDKYKSFKKVDPTCHIVFLGDYTGGGPQNVECLMTILKLKKNDPLYVHLCRGNHETTDDTEDNSVYPELVQKYGERRASEIYQDVAYFYASLSPMLIINRNILCCHGMIPKGITRQSTFKFTPNMSEDQTLMNIVWSNYPAPIAENREYGQNVSPKELFERCYALHVTKIIKAHDYSGSGNRLGGSGIDVNIITSSIWKGLRSTFYKYDDNDTPTKELRPDPQNVSKYITCAFMQDNKISYSPYLEYEDKVYLHSLGFST